MNGQSFRVATTTPIWMILADDKSFVSKEMLAVDILVGSPKVRACKRILGRQDYCFQGSYRYWVWERFSSEGVFLWRLYASRRGMSLEIPEDLSKITRAEALVQARKAWEDFKDSMGIAQEQITRFISSGSLKGGQR